MFFFSFYPPLDIIIANVTKDPFTQNSTKKNEIICHKVNVAIIQVNGTFWINEYLPYCVHRNYLPKKYTFLNLLCIRITILIFPIFIALFISVTCTVPNFRFIIIFFLNHVSTVLLSVGILCVSLSVCVFFPARIAMKQPSEFQNEATNTAAILFITWQSLCNFYLFVFLFLLQKGSCTADILPVLALHAAICSRMGAHTHDSS